MCCSWWWWLLDQSNSKKSIFKFQKELPFPWRHRNFPNRSHKSQETAKNSFPRGVWVLCFKRLPTAPAKDENGKRKRTPEITKLRKFLIRFHPNHPTTTYFHRSFFFWKTTSINILFFPVKNDAFFSSKPCFFFSAGLTPSSIQAPKDVALGVGTQEFSLEAQHLALGP